MEAYRKVCFIGTEERPLLHLTGRKFLAWLRGHIGGEFMAKTKLNPCGCDMFIPFGFKTHFLGIQISASVMCICCRKKVRARTLEKAIEKWNKKMDKGG